MKLLQILSKVRGMSYPIHRSRQSGFTLIELLIVVLIAGILGTMSYPAILNQIGKARVAEARNGLGAINRAQQAYLFEYSQFATSMEALSIEFTLGEYIDGNFVTRYYVYSVQDTATTFREVHHLAEPINGASYSTRPLVSAVYHQPTYFAMVICEASQPTVTPSLVDRTTCNNGRLVR